MATLQNTLHLDGFHVPTSFGKIAVFATVRTHDNGGNPVLVCIHGNSHSSEIFRHILKSSLSQTHRVIAIDLPGHGLSDDASDPVNTYTMPAFARCVYEVLEHLSISNIVVFGWSLGGHIGIEMMASLSDNVKLQGVMIVGTPPIGHDEVEEGFTFGPGGWKSSYAGRSELSAQERDDYAHVCAAPPYESWMIDAVNRTDARFRGIMFNHLVANKGIDNRKVVENNVDIPLAVVNGAAEPFISMKFVREVRYGMLWRDECIEMEGLLHAPFWTDPDAFQKILNDFVRDCS